MNNTNKSFTLKAVKNINILFILLMLIIGFFIIRLFYIQVIRYSYYKHSALSDQLQQSKIPASRGLIEAHNGNQIIPIVLNQEKFTVYVDPTLIKNVNNVAEKIVNILGGSKTNLVSLMKTKNC
jgi:cell division protein FtsI/penicillin-binding protein 2